MNKLIAMSAILASLLGSNAALADTYNNTRVDNTNIDNTWVNNCLNCLYMPRGYETTTTTEEEHHSTSSYRKETTTTRAE